MRSASQRSRGEGNVVNIDDRHTDIIDSIGTGHGEDQLEVREVCGTETADDWLIHRQDVLAAHQTHQGVSDVNHNRTATGGLRNAGPSLKVVLDVGTEDERLVEGQDGIVGCRYDPTVPVATSCWTVGCVGVILELDRRAVGRCSPWWGEGSV